MLVLSRKRNEDIVLRLQRLSGLRAWMHRLPIDQDRLTAGLELLEELEDLEMRVRVVAAAHNVKLGITAPRDVVSIQREEVEEPIAARAAIPA